MTNVHYVYYALGLVLFMCTKIYCQDVPPRPEYPREPIYPNDITRTTQSRDVQKFTNEWEESGLVEGDIVLSKHEDRVGVRNQALLWPDGVVSYYIDTNFFNNSQTALIKKAMRAIERVTCIRFRKYEKTDKAYISISGKEKGCWSLVGKHRRGQTVNLQVGVPRSTCLRKGTIMHELLHSIGFFHQHSAPDRDKYIEIVVENIKPEKMRQFRLTPETEASDLGLPYDYDSIMHYSNHAFSKNGKKTILAKLNNKGKVLGQRKKLSDLDIAKVNLLYKCSLNKIAPQDSQSVGRSKLHFYQTPIPPYMFTRPPIPVDPRIGSSLRPHQGLVMLPPHLPPRFYPQSQIHPIRRLPQYLSQSFVQPLPPFLQNIIQPPPPNMYPYADEISPQYTYQQSPERSMSTINPNMERSLTESINQSIVQNMPP